MAVAAVMLAGALPAPANATVPTVDRPLAIAVSPTSAGPVVISSSGVVSKPIVALAGLGFIVRHPTLPVFYAANERGARQGRVTAFSFVDGRAALLGSASTGLAPVALALDPLGRFLVSADYNGASITRVPVRENGSLGKAVTVKVPSGKGPDPSRQDRPHPHSVAISADGQFVVVTDLGGDALHVYELASLRLVGTERLPPGTGPRTAAFVNAFTIVVTEELSGSVSWWEFDRGNLRFGRRIALNSTIPSDAVVSDGDGEPTVLVIARGTDELVEVLATGLGQRWPTGRCGARVAQWSADGALLVACTKAGALRTLRLGRGELREGPTGSLTAISGLVAL
jgi:6-phosphogluconolactonase